ncbi:hypothetical protein C7S17_5037 [Burkholderia thailandensis]|nr:hypothetical protein [Burkholderia thailandensis]
MSASLRRAIAMGHAKKQEAARTSERQSAARRCAAGVRTSK